MAMVMEMEMNNFLLLPPEITADILSRVPTDSVFKCKLVCKTWQSLIDHPSFIDSHTRHVFLDDYNSASMSFFICSCFIHQIYPFKLHLGKYNEDDEGIMPFKLSKPITCHPYPLIKIYNNFKLDIRGQFDSVDVISYNGLIFTGSTLKAMDMLYIYNPFTREYVDILPSFISSGIFTEIYNEAFIANGFGYHHSTNEYKIVRICFSHEKSLGHASVYTLGSGQWRSLGEIPHSLLYNNPGVFANGAIYWLELHGNRMGHKRIVSFDLNDEEFRIVPSPVPACTVYNQLGVLRGQLCVISPQYVNGKNSSDIWITTNKECTSWTRKCNVPLKYDLLQNKLVAISKGDKILFLCNIDGCLLSYDPKTESLSGIENAPALKRFHMIPYAKSLVSLKGIGEEDAKCMQFGLSCLLMKLCLVRFGKVEAWVIPLQIN